MAPLAAPPALLPFKIDTEKQRYPIVYVRGFTPTGGSREDTFYDTYYGYAETAVEKRDAPPPQFLEPVVFEGQLVRFLKEYGYVDAANQGLALAVSNGADMVYNPTQSLWISRFYDRDVIRGSVRSIEEHAEDLRELICERIPKELLGLRNAQVDLGGPGNPDYKVILIAHSMGGLVCRCLLQNLLPARGEDPKRWVHRLVTIGTPHGGIELSAIPDMLEDFIASKGNPLNTAIFKEPRMREYLKLKERVDGKLPDLNSLNGKFPEGRCFCVIGSDHDSYNVVKKVTGNHSDGLVKQDRAYIKGAYWANIHRAHSGRRGIVNSFETYENIRRFLFGDTRVRMWLEGVDLKIAKPAKDIKEFYDVEFSLSVRGTGLFLHQRKQNPCENAMRFERKEFPLKSVHLHTAFLDTKLRPRGEKFSHFLLAFRVAQHRIQDGFFFDHQYPERTIYSETMEVRVNLVPADGQGPPAVEFRWLSETTDLDDVTSWTAIAPDANGVFRFPFRHAGTIGGDLCVQGGAWPDANVDRTDKAGVDAVRA
jgi:pimeloyl-ACP methyl ester carboxylesterase